MQRWDQGFDVFNVECRLGGNAILCEELVKGCPQKLAIDEEFQGDGLLCVQETVDEGRQLVAS